MTVELLAPFSTFVFLTAVEETILAFGGSTNMGFHTGKTKMFVKKLVRLSNFAVRAASFGYSALAFGPHACIKHSKRCNSFNLKIHILPLVGSIHQHSLSAEILQVPPQYC